MSALFTSAFAPFTMAIVLLGGLLALEIVALLMGASLVSETDGPDLEFEIPELDVPEIEALELGEIDVDTLEIGDADLPEPAAMGWTGFGHVPFLIWFSALLTGFGGTGIALQMVGPFPLWLAMPVAAIAGLAFTRSFAGLFARAIPRTETAAQNLRNLARRRGVVTQGTSRRGRPAELRVTDRYGNSHYVRAEPFRDDDEITRGAEVLTIWDHRARVLRIVPLD
ncbi:MAG: OB-fold-containig protein [Pseudomonadota bacterium]